MRKFQFRLKTLLKLRELEEKQAKIKLAEATNQLFRAQELLKSLTIQLENSFDGFRHKQRENATIDTLKVYHDYFDKLNEDIHKQQEVVCTTTQLRLDCLHQLETAVKNRQLVQKIHEKQFNAYNVELLQEEQKFLDEIGIQLYSQQNMKSGV